ncbi:response regulator transcription factor [Ginsengibacter hankyongi]|uniref:Response regulator transcription factor n=1 Tax=Ginsengibacter hankyongi TaxID=2607284 RepID=A0A5J5IF65_9BACT|nr:LytTR family DNA-binding domain-containing protein [Ginsengibacter hankyongi]KAA9038379.1 response regulator transcription factor [Ginsengibacter hankyongi]
MHNNKKINCLLVDDEPPALEVLKKYIGAVASLELAGTSNNAVEALNFLSAKTIDLLFLDIEMPDLLGTDLIRTFKNPPKVIFTTAYRKYAIEGFELDAVDYLLKPISFERFLKAVNKVMETNFKESDSAEMNAENPVPHNFITVRADRKNLKIALDDILYIESLKDYIKIVTLSKNIITKQSISSLEETLPNDKFLRIHRSFIVAINKVESFTNDTIEIARHELPISRMYRHEVEKLLNV